MHARPAQHAPTPPRCCLAVCTTAGRQDRLQSPPATHAPEQHPSSSPCCFPCPLHDFAGRQDRLQGVLRPDQEVPLRLSCDRAAPETRLSCGQSTSALLGAKGALRSQRTPPALSHRPSADQPAAGHGGPSGRSRCAQPAPVFSDPQFSASVSRSPRTTVLSSRVTVHSPSTLALLPLP